MSSSTTSQWQSEFGIVSEGPKVFFGSEAELNASSADVPQSHVLRRAFDSLKLDGILCTEKTPLVYFKLVNRIEVAETALLHHKFWNHGGAPILVLVAPNEIIDSETAQQKLRDARDRILAGDVFAEVAKLVSDDTGSANNGGEMGWANPGSFVPEFEKVADEIEIGVLSEPFETRFGWHILEVTDRRTYDNTEDVKERNCVERIRNSKVADESELWARRIRDEAFVDKRI